MNAHGCCEVVLTGSNRGSIPMMSGARIAMSGPRPRRWREIAGWIVPSSILALLPKCPACIAAYFAIGGGIGISISTAMYLRRGLVVLCMTSLGYFAVSRARRYGARRRESAPFQTSFGGNVVNRQKLHDRV